MERTLIRRQKFWVWCWFCQELLRCMTFGSSFFLPGHEFSYLENEGVGLKWSLNLFQIKVSMILSVFLPPHGQDGGWSVCGCHWVWVRVAERTGELPRALSVWSVGCGGPLNSHWVWQNPVESQVLQYCLVYSSKINLEKEWATGSIKQHMLNLNLSLVWDGLVRRLAELEVEVKAWEGVGSWPQ